MNIVENCCKTIPCFIFISLSGVLMYYWAKKAACMLKVDFLFWRLIISIYHLTWALVVDFLCSLRLNVTYGFSIPFYLAFDSDWLILFCWFRVGIISSKVNRGLDVTTTGWLRIWRKKKLFSFVFAETQILHAVEMILIIIFLIGICRMRNKIFFFFEQRNITQVKYIFSIVIPIFIRKLYAYLFQELICIKSFRKWLCKGIFALIKIKLCRTLNGNIWEQ